MYSKIVPIALAIFICGSIASYFVLQGDSVVPFIPPDSALSSVTIGGTPIKVTVVRTRAEQEQGLSGRKGLAPNQGMLFVFEKPGDYRIWMKDMLFPIDVVWVDENGSVVDITEAIGPDTYPTVFGSRLPAKYILELSAGFVERYNIARSDKVQF
jgi:uncharacterized membrane protein (UPF0127 family)